MTDEQRARELAERVQLLVLCGGDCMTHVTALLLPLIRDQRRLTELEVILSSGAVALKAPEGCKIVDACGRIEGTTLRAAIDKARGET